MATEREDGRSRLDQLPRQMAVNEVWRTPISRSKGGGDTYAPDQIFIKMSKGQTITVQDQMVLTGPITNGSSATTEKRDVSRGVPNPTFAMWLMGFPENLRNAILRVCSSLPSRGGNKPGRSRETP
jgi:hypothetical protein